MVSNMDCTGDIDWYKIEISQLPARLEIELVNLPGNSDFDLIAYNANLVEMRMDEAPEPETLMNDFFWM